MMYHKVIVLVVFICSANATFIINAYDDGQESLSSESSCNYQACDQLCRRLGFPSGACVGDRCKCDNFKESQVENEIPQAGNTAADRVALDEEEEPAGQKSLSFEDSCNYQACDQLCRRLGFPGGACVGDRCQCDNFKESQAGQKSLSFEDSCNYQACDQLCRRLGFPGGACVGDRCQCDNFKQSQDENEIPQNSHTAANHVVLDNEEESEENEISEDDKAVVEQIVLGDQEEPVVKVRFLRSLSGSCDCVTRDCDFFCFRKRYSGGICVTGQCRCYK